MENKVSIQLSSQEQTTIHDALEQIKGVLDQYLIALTPTERHNLPKMGDGTAPFVNKVLEYAESNPNFAPPYMEVNELRIDLESVGVLTKVWRTVQQLNSNLDDTIMQAGSEAYTSALAYYQSAKTAARMDVPDAKSIYGDLRNRFLKRGGNDNDDDTSGIGVNEDGVG